MSAKRQGVYRHQDLVRLFNPRSIAIVGVSPNPGPFGSKTLANVELGGYAGKIYPINAKYDRIGERICYPSIKALPEPPDMVVIAIPRESVEASVLDAAENGAGGIVLLSSGYSETGKPERIAQQERLVEIVRANSVRLIGPNCIGFLNYGIDLLATFTEVPNAGRPRSSAIGVVSQSGALAHALMQACEHGVSYSHSLTSGNACDVDAADQISYLAGEPTCSAIACLFEGMSTPERLLEAANLAHEAGKPLIIYKMATGEQGAAAAMSHTGSLAGSNAAYSAAFRRAGVIELDKFESLIETTSFFAKAPRPSAPGVALVATSGGACIMAADKAELHGVPLPQPMPDTRRVLESVIPEFGSPKNPCDVTAQVVASPEGLYACADALMKDDNYATVALAQPYSASTTAERAKVFSDAAKRYNKVACLIWLTEHLEGPGVREAEMDSHVAVFRSVDRCFQTLAAWQARDKWMAALPRRLSRVSPKAAAATAAGLIDASKNKTLTEREAKEVLAAYGVPVVGEKLVQSADEAAAAAKALGFPVALKVESPDLPHKTEAGVIRLGMKNEAEVKAAFDAVMANAHKVSPKPRINGVLVQPMISAGTEIMIGARIDPMFGPLIVAGLGGILVELLKDTSVDLAPVNHTEAREMLSRLKGQSMLSGFRGSEPVDVDKLADIICRLSEFADDQKDRIAELDVNPLICSGGRITAVDALIVRK